MAEPTGTNALSYIFTFSEEEALAAPPRLKSPLQGAD
jgi:hypothetical protein